MKIINSSLILAFIALSMSSCDYWKNCPRAKGELITEDRQLDRFQTIDMRASGDVYITVDPKVDAPEVRIKTHESIMENIETRVIGERLIIETDPCVRKLKTLNVYIVTNDLSEISVSGSADIHGQNTFLVDDLDLTIQGSGNVELQTETDELEISISGSGNVDVSGEARIGDFNIQGSGDIDAFELPLEECFINISGSGNCNVDVSSFLSVDISGSGDVIYEGQPQTEITVSGSGDVRPK